MIWHVEACLEFAVDFGVLAKEVKLEINAMVELLEAVGPHLKRPHCDTLSGSRHANMKELRFSAANGVWRLAYAFDPERKAILLVVGDKSGLVQSRFYKTLIRKADARFDAHLARLEKEKRR